MSTLDPSGPGSTGATGPESAARISPEAPAGPPGGQLRHGGPAAYTATQESFARCRRYRMENGLYGVVEPTLGRIMLEVGAVGAITVPAALGGRMRARLAAGPPRGPIIGHPRSSRWTFLTDPAAGPGDQAVTAELLRLGASLPLPGTHIVLPSPTDERTGYRVWIDPPDGDFRPGLAEVVAAVRECRINGSAAD
ncbi:hypothetical protein BJY24_002669 [Nocardia transvalensis]|uniref:DNA-directed RNA polymerase subunit beta n=1 Tax=Nocardia transvalensis TaxID=37333 RepID=A0A7W9UI52_9NOCA|nr:hypothetical protein [Nocardia transvalensis]MBB5913802.1 hypothetical protein [Nocardia transvalensis]